MDLGRVYLIVTRSNVSKCIDVGVDINLYDFFPDDMDGAFDIKRILEIQEDSSRQIQLIGKDHLFEYLNRFKSETFLVDVIWAYQCGYSYMESRRLSAEIGRLHCTGYLTNLAS